MQQYYIIHVGFVQDYGYGLIDSFCDMQIEKHFEDQAARQLSGYTVAEESLDQDSGSDHDVDTNGRLQVLEPAAEEIAEQESVQQHVQLAAEAETLPTVISTWNGDAGSGGENVEEEQQDEQYEQEEQDEGLRVDPVDGQSCSRANPIEEYGGTDTVDDGDDSSSLESF